MNFCHLPYLERFLGVIRRDGKVAVLGFAIVGMKSVACTELDGGLRTVKEDNGFVVLAIGVWRERLGSPSQHG